MSRQAAITRRAEISTEPGVAPALLRGKDVPRAPEMAPVGARYARRARNLSQGSYPLFTRSDTRIRVSRPLPNAEPNLQRPVCLRRDALLLFQPRNTVR